MSRAKVVPFGTYPNEIEASLVAQRLESNGVPAAVKPLGGGYGALGVTQFMHHRVYVPEDMMERARQIVEAEPGAESEPDPASAE